MKVNFIPPALIVFILVTGYFAACHRRSNWLSHDFGKQDSVIAVNAVNVSLADFLVSLEGKADFAICYETLIVKDDPRITISGKFPLSVICDSICKIFPDVIYEKIKNYRQLVFYTSDNPEVQ